MGFAISALQIRQDEDCGQIRAAAAAENADAVSTNSAVFQLSDAAGTPHAAAVIPAASVPNAVCRNPRTALRSRICCMARTSFRGNSRESQKSIRCAGFGQTARPSRKAQRIQAFPAPAVILCTDTDKGHLRSQVSFAWGSYSVPGGKFLVL